MICEFVVGQKVVAMGQGWIAVKSGRFVAYSQPVPAENEICTVMDIFAEGENVFLRLEGFDGAFIHSRFRPLAEPSIEVFERLLEQLPTRVKERA